MQSKKAQSRTQAQELITNGHVYIKLDQKVQKLIKSSFEVTAELEPLIGVESNLIQKYVSRGGLKLEAAIKKLNLLIKNKIVLDVGQSTGGFTDCLLQLGALQVVGIDVGHNQLHASLKTAPNVMSIEGLHVKNLATHQEFCKAVPKEKFSLVVADVSFISLTKVMGYLKPFLADQADYLFLVKPQFEAGPDALDKNGIVIDEKFYGLVENQVKESAVKTFGSVISYFKSELPGKDGNQEFFIYGKNQA
ncbi:MAG: TlyA family RNA methyltransferase [Bdellovibrionaceae bacterium]|nr:TlyA family RNA methyltransferase [Bdellovibrio sp.]